MTSTSHDGPGGQQPGLAPGAAPSVGNDPQRAGTEPVPAPGELHLKERRTWKTWQLALGMLVAALVGMALNYNSSSASSSSSGTKAYTLPPPAASGSSAPTTTTPSTTLPAGSTKTTSAHSGSTHSSAARSSATTSTTAPAATTTTTAASGSTSTTVAQSTGPIQILVPDTQLHGNWTSPAFTITSPPWNIGWAFQCTPAPASGPSFQVFVAPSGGQPSSTPAVNESGASGQQVTQVSSTGSQVVMVQAPANCVWAIKITGH
ncbi:MAG: hypothetical protein ACLP9C_07815 [Acidimicrobiales bacterium]